jgi:hypothetical protein
MVWRVAFLVVGLVLQVAAASAGAAIRWQVHNPFRLFVDPEDSHAHRQAFEAYKTWLERAPKGEKDKFAAEGKGPIYFAEIHHFAARHALGQEQLPYLKRLKSKPDEAYRGWAEAVVGKGRNKTCFNQDTQQYSACEKDGAQAKSFKGGSYLNPTSHDIQVWIESSEPVDGECVWSWRGNQSSHEKSLPARPCAARALLAVNYGETSTVVVRRANAPSGSQPLAEAPVVQVMDLLIVGLGDSFGSGEGNPDSPIRLTPRVFNNYEAYQTTYEGDARDWCLTLAKGGKNVSVAEASCGKRAIHYPLGGYPAREGAPSSYTEDSSAYYNTREDYFVSDPFTKGRSAWLSDACHRSLYSHQLRVALQLALEDDHRAVTFLGFACTGAEILEGLLLKEDFNLERELTESRRVEMSQLSALSRDLCRTDAHSTQATKVLLRDELGADYRPELFDPKASKAERLFKDNKDATALICKKRKRDVDLVLLSFGGNDIGFVPLVGKVVAGHDELLEGWRKIFRYFYTAEDSRKRLPMLEARYHAADAALRKFLGLKNSERDRVLLPGYPTPVSDESGGICSGKFYGAGGSLTPTAQGMDLHPLFRFNQKEAAEIERYTSREFYGTMKRAAQNRWTFVDRHIAAFARHGICASAKLPANAPEERKVAENMRMPRCPAGRDGECQPNWHWSQYNPDRFSAYVSRQRWVRTFNDAYLADHFHPAPDASIVNDKASWQLAAAAAYSGAFHPSAEGQAVVADAILLQARCVLLQSKRVSAQENVSNLYGHCLTRR